MTKPKNKKATADPAPEPKPGKTALPGPCRAESKTDKLIGLLRREGGATLVDMTEATGWLPHSARAMLSGLRKKGYTLDKTRVDGVTRYAVTGEPAA